MTTFGSVCSGIEAASAAWHPLGWRAAWLAEIEPFPCAVLAHHYPTVPNLGDMTTIAPLVRAGAVAAPDVFTGGTPCQAFSVAGKRESLADARGNLSLVFCEIADAIDDVRRADGREPCVVVWENVPGVLSTSDNAFGCFLGALAGADDALVAPGGRWSDAGVVLGPRRAVAWRILDAQFFGLAQRRRRVFVVASARERFDPAAVLLEFEGVRRDSAPSRQAREEAAAGAGSGAAFGGNDTRGPIDVATARNASASASGRLDFESETFIVPTLDASFGRLQGCSGQDANHGHGHLIAHTLRGEGFDASEDGTGRGTPLVAVAFTTEQTPKFNSDCALTLTKQSPTGGGQVQCVAFSCKDHGADAGELAPTLRAMGHGDSHANGGGQVAVAFGGQMSVPQVDVELSQTLQAKNPQAAAIGMQVRRLTPEECEKLQGFSPGYTRIPWRKKPAADCPDGPRYKALGNSWAVPCAAWIGRRIDEQLTRRTE